MESPHKESIFIKDPILLGKKKEKKMTFRLLSNIREKNKSFMCDSVP